MTELEYLREWKQLHTPISVAFNTIGWELANHFGLLDDRPEGDALDVDVSVAQVVEWVQRLVDGERGP